MRLTGGTGRRLRARGRHGDDDRQKTGNAKGSLHFRADFEAYHVGRAALRSARRRAEKSIRRRRCAVRGCHAVASARKGAGSTTIGRRGSMARAAAAMDEGSAERGFDALVAISAFTCGSSALQHSAQCPCRASRRKRVRGFEPPASRRNRASAAAPSGLCAASSSSSRPSANVRSSSRAGHDTSARPVAIAPGETAIPRASRSLEKRNSNSCISHLMSAAKTETHVSVLGWKRASRADHLGAALARDLLDGRERLRRHLPDDNRDAGFDDAGLLHRDLPQRPPEILLVIETDRCDRSRHRS